jgi:hypothetical protein
MTDPDQLVTWHFIVEATLTTPLTLEFRGSISFRRTSQNIMDIFPFMERYRAKWKRVLFSKHAQVFKIVISIGLFS